MASRLTQQALSNHNTFIPLQTRTMSSFSIVSDTSSGLPPAKRAKVMKTPTFQEVDLAKLTLNGYKLPATGKTSYTPMLEDGVRVRFDVTPPGSLVFSNWGFETNYKLNPEKKPSFLGGPATTRSECLEMNVELSEAQAEFIKALDSKLADEFGKVSKSTWHPAIKCGADGVSMMKLRVQMTGDDPAALKVMADGTFHKGSGWSFLEPWMAKTRNFGPCKAKVVLTAQRLWEMGGRAGIYFQAPELTLMSVAKPRQQFESAQDDEAAMMADFEI